MDGCEYEYQRSGEVEKRHTENGTKQFQRRAIQLRVGRSRNHTPYVREAGVWSDAIRVVGQAEPNTTSTLDKGGEGAIVDQIIVNCGKAACGLQRVPPNQHDAARRRCDCRAVIVDGREGEEFLKEENEGRDQHALPEMLAMKAYHQRHEVLVLHLRLPHEPPHSIRGMGDVGIRKQYVGMLG